MLNAPSTDAPTMEPPRSIATPIMAATTTPGKQHHAMGSHFHKICVHSILLLSKLWNEMRDFSREARDQPLL